MKKTLLIALVLMAATATFAQRTVSGKVIDKELNEPVIQATVALLKTDSSLVANAVTNVSGQFQLTAPQDGNFIVKITYVGYKAYTKRIAVSEGKPVGMETITIEPDAIMLKGTTVVKNVAKVTSKGDTLIYNASAYRTPEGSVVEELVKRLPGAEVDTEGNVTINGKQVKKVMIDGKEFMTGDTKTAIKNLPTSIVERVKSYDQKSDLSRVTGIDDGEEQMVLDFGLKKGMNKGMFSNVDLGIGNKSRYSERGMGAVMQDDLRAMAFFNANNTNERGFGGGGGRGGGWGGNNNGLNASKMVGVNLNYEKKDRLKLDGSVRWNHSDGDTWSRQSSEDFVGARSFGNSVNQRYSRSNSWNLQMRMEWTPDTLWNISFRPSYSYSSNDGTGLSTSATFTTDPFQYVSGTLGSRSELLSAIDYLRNLRDTFVVNGNLSNSLSYGDSKRLGGELQINRRLSSDGRNITLRLTGNYSDAENNSLSSNAVTLYQLTNKLGLDSAYQTNRYNLTPQKNYDYSTRLTYSEPIATRTYLQFSYQFQYRYTKSDRSTYDFSNPPYSYDFTGITPEYRLWNGYFDHLSGVYTDYIDKDLSRFSEYKNYIHTAEVQLRVIRQDYNFNVGLQLMPQRSNFRQEYLGTSVDTVRNVINWSPTANFRWKASERGELRFEYRGRTGQPSMSQLLSITDNSDPLNISTGNPGLKPSFTQSLNLRFNNFWERYQRFMFANVSFSTTSNDVANMVTYNATTGGRYSRPENIDGNWNMRGELMLNTALDTLGRFNVNTRTTYSYNNRMGYVNLDRSAVATESKTRESVIGERLGASYRNDWLEVELNGSVSYDHARNNVQSQSDLDTWEFSYGMNTTIQLPWGTQIATDLGMNSRRGFSDESMNTNELIWNLQLSQGFLTGKPLTVSLQFNDLLGQKSSFSRALSSLRRSDTEYNSINNYAMLHVIYRLNIFGTKEARQGMRGPGFGGPGFGGGRNGGGGNRRGGGNGRPGGGFGGRF